MISYAQNQEDVLLWRCLKDIKFGHYLDIGAQGPVKDSVTNWFYSEGWRGINVEPNSTYYAQLEKHRPGDINLQLVVSSQNEQVEFYEIEGSGLSTTNFENIGHLNIDPERVTKVIKSAISASTLLSHYEWDVMHFLKIDVEGMELEVIRNFDFRKIRPWIIVAEAYYPTTQIPSYGEWEKILIANNYCFALDDGLNRYYVDDNFPNYLEILKHPVSVFDDFTLSTQLELEKKIFELEKKIFELEKLN